MPQCSKIIHLNSKMLVFLSFKGDSAGLLQLQVSTGDLNKGRPGFHIHKVPDSECRMKM